MAITILLVTQSYVDFFSPFFEIDLFGYIQDPMTKYTMLMPIDWLLGIEKCHLWLW